MTRRKFFGRHNVVAAAHAYLAIVCQATGDFTLAVSHFQQSLAIQKDMLGEWLIFLNHLSAFES
mgnify:FL=1